MFSLGLCATVWKTVTKYCIIIIFWVYSFFLFEWVVAMIHRSRLCLNVSRWVMGALSYLTVNYYRSGLEWWWEALIEIFSLKMNSIKFASGSGWPIITTHLIFSTFPGGLGARWHTNNIINTPQSDNTKL